MDPYRKFKQKDCPACLDLSWLDEDGNEHIVFDICITHLKMGVEENVRDFGNRKQRRNKLREVMEGETEEDEDDDDVG